jgi:hypothetical protein
VRDARRRLLAINRVLDVASAHGFRILQSEESPRSHAHGNREIFVYLRWLMDAGAGAAASQARPASQLKSANEGGWL